MTVERSGPAVCNGSNKTGGKGEMTTAPISLQDLRRSLLCQGEGRTALAFLGTVRPRLEDGNLASSLSDGQEQFEFVLHAGQRMGRTEGQAASDACPGTTRPWLEAME